MLFHIPKYFHRAVPFTLGIWYRKTVIRKRVTFSNSCRYDLNSIDQEDINKLFGIGFFPSHHKDSARFGWNYEKETGLIKVYSYCYVNGERKADFLCQLPINKAYDLTLTIGHTHYIFTVYGEGLHFTSMVKFDHQKSWSFPLGLHFGGNRKAPHTISVQMKNL